MFVGDGCLMEGISHEAASFAGTWQLNKLIAIYDDNGISIDGEVKHWFTDNTAQRFEAYGWNVIGPIDGHNVDAVDRAIARSKTANRAADVDRREDDYRQGLAGRAGTEKAHGEALGEKEIEATRAALGWPHQPFAVPDDVYAAWDAKNGRRRARSEMESAVARVLGALSAGGRRV